MTYSTNEIEALATKAARGSGAHAAQAAAFGKAVVRHIAAHRDETDILDGLNALPGGPIQTLPFAPDTSPLSQSYQDRADTPTRLSLSSTLLAELTKRAHNTYVPNTDSSRNAGAGAGLSDND